MFIGHRETLVNVDNLQTILLDKHTNIKGIIKHRIIGEAVDYDGRQCFYHLSPSYDTREEAEDALQDIKEALSRKEGYYEL